MDLREQHTGTSRHPWETTRFRFFKDVLRDNGCLACCRKVLDMGAGDAWFAEQLLKRLPADATIDCVDAGYAEETTHTPRLHKLRQRPDQRYDLVLLLDVLEHVADDDVFLSDLAAHALAPTGRLLLSVPTWQALYTSHDTFLQHHRRYAPAQARRLIEAAGLQVEQSGGLFHSLLAPRAVSKAREQWLGAPANGHSDLVWHHGPLFTAAVKSALTLDNLASRWLSRHGRDVPGLTWWALCRPKRGE
jgi:hypothetical protein